MTFTPPSRDHTYFHRQTTIIRPLFRSPTTFETPIAEPLLPSTITEGRTSSLHPPLEIPFCCDAHFIAIVAFKGVT
ncbi:hypothetical protein Dimus_025297, partial [Dionaea muscipula]